MDYIRPWECLLCCQHSGKLGQTQQNCYTLSNSSNRQIVAQFGQWNALPSSFQMNPRLKLQHANYKNMLKDTLDEIQKLPYWSLIGCLLYLSIGTHLYIIYSIQQFSQYLDCYSYAHWNAAICVVHYLSGMQHLKLCLSRTNQISLLGFTNLDWANCLNMRGSVGGHTYSLGSGVMSWQARKQKTVAASSCKAEYTATFEACKRHLVTHAAQQH